MTGNHQPKVYVPKSCLFEVTLACNIRCLHCGSRAGEPRPDELTLGQIADTMRRLADLGCERVVVSGGEALMRPDWAQIVAAAAGTGMRVGLITNGILFDETVAVSARRAGLRAVGFSLDGVGASHDRQRRCPGLFERVLGAMRTARRAGVPFSAITQVNRSNLSELARIRDLLTEEGAYAWQVQPAVKMGELCGNPELAPRPSDIVAISRAVARLIEESSLKIYAADSLGYFGPQEKVLRKHAGGTRFGGCEAGLENVGIESNGDVKGCLALMPGHNPRRGDFVEGNVKDAALERIWNRPGAFAYNREFTIDDLEGFCRSCAHAQRCRGGCRSCVAASGSGAGNPMCEHRVLSERRSRGGLARPAAAAILASALSLGAQGCRSVGPIGGGDEKDAGADTDTDSEFQGAYGFPDTDTEGEIDTDPDAGVDAGGIYIYTQQLPD